MVAVLIPISKVIRLVSRCRVSLLYLGRRLAHPAKSHLHGVRDDLGFTCCRDQAVEGTVLISMDEHATEFSPGFMARIILVLPLNAWILSV